MMGIAGQSLLRSAGTTIVLGWFALLAASLPVAKGCAICADIPGASGPLGPRLLEIASAIRHEIDSGGLDPSPGAPLPTSGRGLGHRMARMLTDHPDWNHSFEFLLIDSGARFRFDPGNPDRGFVAVRATEKSPPPALRWMTGLDVFHALLNGRIEIDTAVVRGILVIESVAESDSLVAGPPNPGDSASGGSGADDQSFAAPGRYGTPILLLILAVLILTPIMLVLRSNRFSRAEV